MAGGYTDLNSQTHICFMSSVQRMHKYAQYLATSFHACVNSQSITPAVQSLVLQSYNTVQCWNVLWWFACIVCSWSTFQKVFLITCCFMSTYEDTLACPSHAQITAITSGRHCNFPSANSLTVESQQRNTEYIQRFNYHHTNSQFWTFT